jgi:sporulation protein YlmC with PRC-barrel domain
MSHKDEPEAGHIAPLGTLGKFEVKNNFRDPRGWDVLLADGTRVGKVNELIVDTAALRTRYLEVKLDKKPINFDHDRNVLIPVGAARLDSDRDHVVLDSVELRQLSSLPPYDRHTLTREYERAVLAGFGSTDNTTEFNPREDSFYQNRSFDDSRFVTQRDERTIERAEATEAKVTDNEIRVPLTDDKIVIERKPAAANDELVIRREPG